jgi:hypothetical protein
MFTSSSPSNGPICHNIVVVVNIIIIFFIIIAIIFPMTPSYSSLPWLWILSFWFGNCRSRFPTRYIRDVALFNACFSRKKIPSARCALDVMLVGVMLTCLEPVLFFLIRYYNVSFFILQYSLYAIWTYVYSFFSPHNGWRDLTFWIIIIVQNALDYISLCVCACFFPSLILLII